MVLTKQLPTHFAFIPRARLYGVFEQPQQVMALRDSIEGDLSSHVQLSVLEGDSGVRQLDSSGMRGGLFARLVRVVQGMTDEQSEIDKYRHALLQGRIVVLVDLPRDNANAKELLRLAFHQAGASSIDYYGNFVNERLRN